jgi:hypothetical protein
MKAKLSPLAATLVAAALFACSANNAQAQTTDGWSTGFENDTTAANPVPYTEGLLAFQDNWDLGGADRSPRVQTSDEIAAELTAAGLNVAQPVHSGNQALIATKPTTNVETTGYFVRDIFNSPNTLDSATKVTVNFWARPLTGGAGADPSGAPSGNNVTIGEREGNVFFGIADSNDGSSGQRAAAIRFGVTNPSGTPPMYGNITARHIDFASATAGSAVWVNSGLSWQADQWYNFKMILDYTAKTYDFYVNGAKVNSDPIVFYHTAANVAKRFFVSKGTNQAGAILDDITVKPYAPNAGDFNSDGKVDGADFLMWQNDNSVGSLAAWQANFGAAGVQSIPEPASCVLAFGAAVLASAAGRRQRRAAMARRAAQA